MNQYLQKSTGKEMQRRCKVDHLSTNEICAQLFLQCSFIIYLIPLSRRKQFTLQCKIRIYSMAILLVAHGETDLHQVTEIQPHSQRCCRQEMSLLSFQDMPLRKPSKAFSNIWPGCFISSPRLHNSLRIPAYTHSKMLLFH